MFHKRFDDHYQDKLTKSQKSFLNDLTFLNQEEVIKTIAKTKERVLSLLEERYITEDNNLLKEQYSNVKSNIFSLDPANEKALARQLTLLQLIDELEGEDE